MKFILSLFLIYFTEIHGWSMSVDEFQKCASAFNHGAPSVSIAKAFIDQAVTRGTITSKLEAFIAISQMAWESVGFTARSEYACSNGQWSKVCDSYVTAGCPAGKKYYGRGFIQLTHCANYKEAEKEFPGIVNDPDKVANNDTIAMGTALLFWKNHVHNAWGVQQGHFGSATRAINGYFECTPGNRILLARERWNRFNACINAAHFTSSDVKEEGCYEGATKLTTPVDIVHKGADCLSLTGEQQYNQWCADDCPHGNCPATVCKCG